MKKFNSLKAAQNMIDNEDYVSALNCLFMDENKNSEVYVKIAEIYYDKLYLVRDSLKFFAKAYVENPGKSSEAARGLALCFSLMGNTEAAYFYLNESGINVGDMSDDDYEDYDEEEFFYAEDIDNGYFDEDYIDKIEEGKYLLRIGDKDKAKALFESIESQSYQYGEALDNLFMMALDNNDLPEAEKYAKMAMEYSPYKVRASVFYTIVKSLMGNNEFVDERSEFMFTKYETEVEDYSITLMYICKYRRYDIAVKFYDKYLVNSKYVKNDRNTLLCMASACSHLGDERAMNFAEKAKILFYKDEVVDELYNRISRGETVTMPADIDVLHKKWIKYIRECVDTGRYDNDLKQKLIWLFENDYEVSTSDEELADIAEKIAEFKEYREIAEQIFVSPLIDDSIKRIFMRRYIADKGTDQIKVIFNGIYRHVKIEHPELEEKLHLAYYNALEALIEKDFGFEDRLKTIIGGAAAAFSAADKKLRESIDVLFYAAALCMEVSSVCVDENVDISGGKDNIYEIARQFLGFKRGLCTTSTNY